MKKIYAFSFDEEDCLSAKWGNKIRLAAYLLYDYIFNFYDETCIPLNINKNIVFNRIHEINPDDYYLDSDYNDDGYINYEPFLINSRCFALTVDDNLISEKQIRGLLELVKNIVHIKCNVSVYSETYMSKNKDDERNRQKTINGICQKNGLQYNKTTSLIRRLTRSSKCRKNMNCIGRY